MGQERILVVCQHFWPESFRINDICDFLIERDCHVEVLCGLPNYPKGELYEGYSWRTNRRQTHNGIEIHRAGEIPRGSNTNFRVFLNYISFPFFSLFQVPKFLFKKFDKILLYQLSPVLMSIAGIIIGKVRRIETTMYVLDLWPENLFSVLPVKNPLLRRLVTAVSHWHYRQVDKLVVLSERMKDRLIAVTQISPDKVIVIPQACEELYETDVDDKALREKFSGKFTVLFTGNISPAQSFETMIEAAKILRDEGLTDILWVIVGDGMSRKWLEAHIEQAGLIDYFHFEGHRPVADMPKYTTVADVLVGCLVKSDLLEATIPAKVMSYIAAGRPMVLAMDGEVRNLINNSIRCGFAGPTEDGLTLAENIKKMYRMPVEERREMGQRGRRYHLEHFQRNLLLKKLYDFMCEDS